MAPKPTIAELTSAAIRCRQLVQVLKNESGVTVALFALSDHCRVLMDDGDRVEAQQAHELLVKLLEQYIRMGRLLSELRGCLPSSDFQRLLFDQGINADLAEHTITLAEEEGF